MTGKELWYISQAHNNCQLSGDGPFTKKCHEWLEQKFGCRKALLTHSCTAALELAAMLVDIQPGDEVIMPSYTFISTANAFVLRGGVPVFVDIRPDTLNIDETKIEAAITPKTKAIIPVHYAGVACEMDEIMEIATRRNLLVVEDAAQGFMSTYKGKYLGTIGHFGTISFHETKNITSGEGGAIFINHESFIDRAEIIREKGTNRSRFFRGQVDKYTWVDIGSSYLPGELVAAFLFAQLEDATAITRHRMNIWQRYNQGFSDHTGQRKFRRPHVPDECHHNAHMYYLLMLDLKSRNDFIKSMNERGICTVFHYVPLHSSPAGKKYCRTHGNMEVTDAASEQLVRLPLWVDLTVDELDYIISTINSWLGLLNQQLL